MAATAELCKRCVVLSRPHQRLQSVDSIGGVLLRRDDRCHHGLIKCNVAETTFGGSAREAALKELTVLTVDLSAHERLFAYRGEERAMHRDEVVKVIEMLVAVNKAVEDIEDIGRAKRSRT